MKFKQTITKVLVKKDAVETLDQNGKLMPFFSGSQNQSMRRIKARIEKQMPCTITWHATKDATFYGFDNEVGERTVTIYYAANGRTHTVSSKVNHGENYMDKI